MNKFVGGVGGINESKSMVRGFISITKRKIIDWIIHETINNLNKSSLKHHYNEQKDLIIKKRYNLVHQIS